MEWESSYLQSMRFQYFASDRWGYHLSDNPEWTTVKMWTNHSLSSYLVGPGHLPDNQPHRHWIPALPGNL